MAHGEKSAYKSNRNRDLWSRRCRAVGGMTKSKFNKKQTIRYERRQAKNHENF